MDGPGPLAAGRALAVRPDQGDAWAAVHAGAALAWRSRTDLVAVQGARSGSGRSDGEFWEAPGWFLKTRATRHFADPTAALAALDDLDQLRRPLGPLVPARSTLLVWEHGDGRWRIWTLAPFLDTLRTRLDRAAAAGDWDQFGRALTAFATGLGETVEASVVHGRGLDANPANFAIQGARLRYLDDDVTLTHDALGVEDAFVTRFREYPDAPAALWEAYERRFGDELMARATADILRRLRLPVRLQAAAALQRRSGPHVARLLARLERGA